MTMTYHTTHGHSHPVDDGRGWPILTDKDSTWAHSRIRALFAAGLVDWSGHWADDTKVLARDISRADIAEIVASGHVIQARAKSKPGVAPGWVMGIAKTINGRVILAIISVVDQGRRAFVVTAVNKSEQPTKFDPARYL